MNIANIPTHSLSDPSIAQLIEQSIIGLCEGDPRDEIVDDLLLVCQLLGIKVDPQITKAL